MKNISWGCRSLTPIRLQTIRCCMLTQILVGLIENVPLKLVLEDDCAICAVDLQGDGDEIFFGLTGNVDCRKIQKNKGVFLQQCLVENLSPQLSSRFLLQL